MATVSGEVRGGQPDWPFLARMFLFTFSGWYQSQAAQRLLDPAGVSGFINQLVGAVQALARAEASQEVSVSC